VGFPRDLETKQSGVPQSVNPSPEPSCPKSLIFFFLPCPAQKYKEANIKISCLLFFVLIVSLFLSALPCPEIQGVQHRDL